MGAFFCVLLGLYGEKDKLVDNFEEDGKRYMDFIDFFCVKKSEKCSVLTKIDQIQADVLEKYAKKC